MYNGIMNARKTAKITVAGNIALNLDKKGAARLHTKRDSMNILSKKIFVLKVNIRNTRFKKINIRLSDLCILNLYRPNMKEISANKNGTPSDIRLCPGFVASMIPAGINARNIRKVKLLLKSRFFIVN